ncbi:MAG: zinc metallopeptidase RseP [Methanocella sp. PtaU1.Bin125]|nr:MAG: zinc metallopeptidase RseP [Methanocella sp. PtaU1.Bin125]
MLDPIWFAVIIGFALWWLGVYTLDRAGVLKRFNITAYGPLIMWRTYRGQGLLNALASPKTFWKALFSLCIPLVFVSMIIMLSLIIITDLVMIIKTPAPSVATAPQNLIVIPGVNQFVPFVWGWIALVVAMAVHEIGHAVMARAEDIKVKSLGLLLIPLPLGAFAEIDEEGMFGTKSESKTAEVLGPMDTKAAGEGNRTASSMGQVRILSAGVISNFLVAVVAFALLFGPVLGAIGATNSGMVVVNVAPGTPAYDAGIQNNLIIHAVDGVNVSTPGQFNDYLRAHAGSDVTIQGKQGSQAVSYTLNAGEAKGLYILGVVPEYPAAIAGIGPNMQMVSVNDTPISDYEDYAAFMANTTPGQTVSVGLIAQNGTGLNTSVVLASGAQPKGYMGFGGADLSDNAIGVLVGTFDAKGQLSLLQNMLAPAGDSIGDKVMSVISGLAIVLFMPLWEVMGGFTGISVFQSDLASLYYPIGWAAGLGNTVFYLALALFWIGWLNMNVGLFNCLPMIPLDGGHIFREVTRVTIGWFIRDGQKVDRISRAIVNGFAITLFSSLVFMIVAPYIVHGLV